LPAGSDRGQICREHFGGQFSGQAGSELVVEALDPASPCHISLSHCLASTAGRCEL
jgi:hypothetical protein